MCCFSRPVELVANTRIFSRLTTKQFQFLVYQMKYETKELNAMILPLPVSLPAREDSVRFISLENYPWFFSDLDKGFPALPDRSLKIASPESRLATDSPLKVHEVGDFVASFVPTVDDFDRLDPQFVISKESWDKIPVYSDYGFAVFQLKSLVAEPHPMAFEFETRFPETIFFPTVHIHDGEVHEREEFDHTLYLQDAAFDKAVGKYLGPARTQESTGFVRSENKAARYCNMNLSQGIIDSELLIHRVQKKGTFANVDFVKDVSPEATRQWTSSGRNLPTYLGLSGMGGVAALAWIIRRRMQLVSRNQQEA